MPDFYFGIVIGFFLGMIANRIKKKNQERIKIMKHDPCSKCGKWCDTHSLWYCEEKDDGELHRYDFVQPEIRK